ncbi:MAG: hypothetical protein PHU14_05610 [Methylovulum sp.]|nr:hypothetical protein [Methylovulum sp.]
MHLYIEREAQAFESPQQYADDYELSEGDEFALMAVEVLGLNTYRIIGGVPTLVAIAQVTGVTG